MPINPQLPQLQTLLFSILLFFAIFIDTKRHYPEFNLSKNITDELKGLAILMILFGHIGYFLSNDHAFLYPLSIASGVGVNLFLFLSGFGLTKSALHKKISILDFFKKRIPRLFLPLWLTLIVFYLTDLLILNKTYPLDLILQNFLGFFPQSDIHKDLNSPLWYFTAIIFYYMIFPFTFTGVLKYFSPLILYFVPLLILNQTLPVTSATRDLYLLHTMAFPLGVFFGLLNLYLPKFRLSRLLKTGIVILKIIFIRYLLIAIGIFNFTYFAIYSGVGTDKHLEQITSIFLMFILIAIFLLKDFKFRSLSLFGVYSYGIYLIHWPIIYRYDLLYKLLPAFLATFIYMFVLLALSKLMQKFTD